MLKFFRTIRKKLIEQGKTANYLKYAIGEIILVVIGILIAPRCPQPLKGRAYAQINYY